MGAAVAVTVERDFFPVLGGGVRSWRNIFVSSAPATSAAPPAGSLTILLAKTSVA
jgi:hypothetical protein